MGSTWRAMVVGHGCSVPICHDCQGTVLCHSVSPMAVWGQGEKKRVPMNLVAQNPDSTERNTGQSPRISCPGDSPRPEALELGRRADLSCAVSLYVYRPGPGRVGRASGRRGTYRGKEQTQLWKGYLTWASRFPTPASSPEALFTSGFR